MKFSGYVDGTFKKWLSYHPCASLASRSAWLDGREGSTRSLTMSSRFARAARCKGISLFSFGRDVLAPDSRRIFATTLWPRYDACKSRQMRIEKHGTWQNNQPSEELCYSHRPQHVHRHLPRETFGQRHRLLILRP
jgi:hypothetical protein